MRAGLILLLVLLGACNSEPQPPLVATEVLLTRPLPGMGMSAAYFSLTNNTDRTISVTHVTSEQYESVALHESTIEDGVARMRAIAELRIGAGETVTLRRGGKHLMLMRPTGPHDIVSLQFFSEDALLLTVNAAFESVNR